MNSFNQQALGQFANYANCQQPGSQVYQQQPQSSGTTANSSLAAMQQFATQSAAASNFVTFQHSYNSVNCLQKEIESLKKQNNEFQSEVEKLRAAYTDCNYQMMTSQMKQGNLQEQIEQLHKEKLEQDKAYKELKLKYDEKFAIFRSPHQSDERSLFCDQCNFEVKSQVALFIHKLNHHFEASIPRHLQLSTRSFSTMPDDNIRFKYKCHCCEIDSEREFARHEIYVHIYQFHTFDTPFKCKFCFLYFTSKSYLNDHLVEKHSLPGGRNKNNKRKSNANEPNIINTNANNSSGSNSSGKPGAMSGGFDQLNSGLTLKGRQSLSQPTNAATSVVKRAKSMANSEHETNDINELFKQLVGETLNDDGGQQQQPNQELMSSMPNQTSNSAIAKSGNAADSKPQQTPQQAAQSQRESEIQQIMNDLDGDDGLNCKYPGCKFVATNKNHLKFHISAHLMSKYKCPYCTFVGNRVIEIKRHILKSTKHTDQHVFLCPDCDFASDCEKTFRDHYSRYHHSGVDLGLVIERMFLNESNKVGQNMLSNAAAANAAAAAAAAAAANQNNSQNNANSGNATSTANSSNNNNSGTGASNQQQPTTTIVQAGGKH